MNSPVQQRNYYRILAILFLLSLPFVNPIVHGDGVGYYAYARAPLIEHSLHFEQDWRHANLLFSQARTGPDGKVLPDEYTETGYVSNLFTIGPAMLWFPFLLVAHIVVGLLDMLGMHIARDGFSFPYIFAMALGTAFYGFLGMVLSFSVARKYVADCWGFLATVGIWWASSLPVYMYFNPAWSHAHSAFAVSLFVWYWDRTRTQRTTGQWLVAGLIAGLMVEIYFPNAVFLLLPLTESLAGYYRLFKTELSPARKLFLDNVLFTLTIAVSFLPTIITRRIIFGGFFEFGSYSHLSWDWSAPHWFSLLFSSSHGLFAWTPLLALALAGLFFAPPAARSLAKYLALPIVAFYYLIASYPYWDGLSSFGNRFFISLTPIYVLGLAFLLQRMSAIFPSPRAAWMASAAVLGCFILWNMAFIYQWGTHMIPARGPINLREMARNQFTGVPAKLVSRLDSYLFHRGELMHEIEEKDMEQLRRTTNP